MPIETAPIPGHKRRCNECGAYLTDAKEGPDTPRMRTDQTLFGIPIVFVCEKCFNKRKATSNG